MLVLAACGGGSLDVSVGSDPNGDTNGLPNGDPNATPNAVTSDMGVTEDATNTVPDVDIVPSDTDLVDVGVPDGDPPDAPPPMCMEADCGPGAGCVDNVCTCDDGLLGDPTVGCSPADPCDGVDCPAGSSCNTDGSCSCDPFFNGDPATGCEPTPPAADLSARSVQDVCDIWTDSFQRSSNDTWMIEPVDACDRGRLHPDELRQALHTTSRFRMIVGLYPVSLSEPTVVTTQECATMHAATNMGLNHTPPNTWNCFTQEGYQGCSSSNLARGINNPAGTVALYVADNGVPSLGHRRWVFNPRMGETAFGHRGSYGAMYSFNMNRSHNPDFVAFPAPGPFPRNALGGKWSIHGGASYNDQHTVTITNMGDGSDVPASNITSPVFGNLASTLAWDVSTPPAGATYRIRIEDDAGALVREYDTTLVDCP